MSENPHTANRSFRVQKNENIYEESTIPKLSLTFPWERERNSEMEEGRNPSS